MIFAELEKGDLFQILGNSPTGNAVFMKILEERNELNALRMGEWLLVTASQNAQVEKKGSLAMKSVLTSNFVIISSEPFEIGTS